jgi:hypothetical protein
MHAIIDRQDELASETARDHADGLRNSVLGLTSALRTAIDQHGNAAALDQLRGIGRSIATAGADAELVPLVRCADGFCQLAAGAWESTAMVDGLLQAVGRIERVLDGCLTGMDGDRLARLCDIVATRELGLDEDEDDAAIDLTLDAAPGGAPAADAPCAGRAPHEQELFDAFAAEALDVLDQCEDYLLRVELDSGDACLLDDVCTDLATIRDAGATVGLFDLAAPLADTTVDGLLECIDAIRQRIEAAWGDSNASAVDPATLLPIEEIFLRLRRTARDVARRQGGWIRVDTQGGDRRVTAALADRIYEPLAQLIADAASQFGPGVCGTLQLGVGRDPGLLALSIDDGPTASGDGASDVDRPEALHWIDARRPATDDEGARLVYRPGSVNVVQIMSE